MANPPPPYDNITGISRAAMKDNAQVTLAEYDGNARPGELVVDQTTSIVYVGNALGDLTAVATPGGATTWALLSNKTGASGPTIIALGQNAGLDGQTNAAIAVGQNAGQGGQNGAAISIGLNAGGNTFQGEYAVAVGAGAGYDAQGNAAVAVGAGAGATLQGVQAVAIGTDAGATSQANRAVAVGYLAGSSGQGNSAVAIGYYAGELNQGNNSIIINATGTDLQQTTANTFTVAPVRNDTSNIAQVVFYNTTSKEITYGNVISVAGNVTGGNILTGGLISASGNITGNYFIGNGSQLTNLPSTDWANIGNITNANGPQNIAIGENVHQTFTYTPGFGTVAVGYSAGQTNQGGLTVAVGWQAGQSNQSNNAIAIGYAAGQTGQEDGAVAIGAFAGNQLQGADAIAIGKYAGYNGVGVAQPDNTIFLNATGTNMGGVPAQTSSFYVKPVRAVTSVTFAAPTSGSIPAGFSPMYYNPTTGEIIVITT